MKTCPCCHNEILDGKELTKKEEDVSRVVELKENPQKKLFLPTGSYLISIFNGYFRFFYGNCSS